MLGAQACRREPLLDGEVAIVGWDDVDDEGNPATGVLGPLKDQTLALGAVLAGEPAVPTSSRRRSGKGLIPGGPVFQRHARASGWRCSHDPSRVGRWGDSPLSDLLGSLSLASSGQCREGATYDHGPTRHLHPAVRNVRQRATLESPERCAPFAPHVSEVKGAPPSPCLECRIDRHTPATATAVRNLPCDRHPPE